MLDVECVRGTRDRCGTQKLGVGCVCERESGMSVSLKLWKTVNHTIHFQLMYSNMETHTRTHTCSSIHAHAHTYMHTHTLTADRTNDTSQQHITYHHTKAMRPWREPGLWLLEGCGGRGGGGARGGGGRGGEKGKHTGQVCTLGTFKLTCIGGVSLRGWVGVSLGVLGVFVFCVLWGWCAGVLIF